MKIFGMVGRSGSGKTTLLKQLLPHLIARGIRVSTIKHTHHGADLDQPGKDSYIHRMAGAEEVMVTSSTRWALMRELRGAPEPNMTELISHMTPVDLLLVEGFRHYRHDRMEIHRAATGQPLIHKDEPGVVAICSDQPLSGIKIPVIDLNDPAAVADFIIAHCELGRRLASGSA